MNTNHDTLTGATNQYKPISDDEKDRIVALRVSGKTFKEISEIVGNRSTSSISHICQRAGIVISEYAIITSEQRFWNRVEKTNTCWNWIAGKSSAGYGMIAIDGVKWYSHRYSFVLHGGALIDGHEIRHMCHNPACVNPKHLEQGTSLQNGQDMVVAGRSARGENHSQAKLTNEDVIMIKNLLAEGFLNQSEIATMFCINPSTVSNIKTGRLWAHLET